MLIKTILCHKRMVAVWVTLALGVSWTAIQAQNNLTPGQFKVNDAGAATYSVPLTVAPGVGRLSPKLSLQYSSQAPNGVFGVGWTLSGVSSITRCAKTPAEDGDRIGVQNNATDLFCLDDQKLRAVSGTYGSPDTKYRTAIDTYGRITSLGNVAGGPQSFTLETKTGEIYTFGGSDGSRLEHPSKGVVRTWMVSEIKDRFNNRISFTYSKDLALGEQLLTQVDYSNGRLQLSYEARPANDQILKYDDGVQYGSTNSRVSTITVAHKPLVSGVATASTLKTYQLQYGQSQASQRSMLRSIRECAADGACLPAISLAYRDGTPGVFLPGPAHSFQVANQHGLRDLAGNGTQSVYPFRTSQYEDIALWDVDGDGRTDILTNTLPPNDSVPARQVIQYANGTETSTTLDYQNQIQCFGDINGDGKSEAIRFKWVVRGGSNSGQTYYSVVEPLGNTAIELGMDPLSACRSVDVDGDGRSEILVYNGSKYSKTAVLLTYKAGVFSRLPLALGMSRDAASLGDFNGDGKTDWIQGNQKFFKVAVPTYISTGKGDAGVAAWTTEVGGVACTGDFNGDGRTDILGGSSRLHLSNGRTSTNVAQNALTDISGVILCGDFNGDGLMDVLSVERYWYNGLPADVDRLIAVDNGVGFAQEVSYKPITDGSVYTKGSGAAYPQIDMQTPIMVVSQVKSGSAAQQWQNTSYRYAGLRADLGRAGTQGFERVTSTHLETGISVATHYNQSFPLTGLRSRVHKYLGSEAAPQTLKNTTFGYLQRALGPLPAHQAAQVHLNQSTAIQYDMRESGVKLGEVRESSDSFDVYGFPISQRIDRYDGAGVLTSSTAIGNTYSHQDASWLLGQLVQTTTTAQNLRTVPNTTAPSSALTLQVNPSAVQATLTAAGAWSTSISATAAGGIGVYTYAWSSSGSRVSITNGSTANPTLSANLSWNESIDETIQVRVADSAGNSVTQNVPVRLVTPAPNVPPLGVSLSSSSISGSRGNPGAVSASVNSASSGGYGTHSYTWARLTGSRIAISNAGVANPSFSANLAWGETLTETFRLTVSDSLSSQAIADLTVSFSTPPELRAAFQPAGDMLVDCSRVGRKSVVASGGTPPYTYQWTSSRTTGLAVTQITQPTSATTEFRTARNTTGEYITVTVRDAAANQVSQTFLLNKQYCQN